MHDDETTCFTEGDTHGRWLTKIPSRFRSEGSARRRERHVLGVVRGLRRRPGNNRRRRRGKEKKILYQKIQR